MYKFRHLTLRLTGRWCRLTLAAQTMRSGLPALRAAHLKVFTVSSLDASIRNMSHRKQKDTFSTSPAPQPERIKLIDEAQALYRRCVDYAVQDIDRLHPAGENAKPAWLKIVNLIGILAVVLTVVILAFGVYAWPDAPIRQTASGYAGKTGIAHTSDEYESFKNWEKTLLVVVPLAFIVNIGAAIISKRRGKHQSLEG